MAKSRTSLFNRISLSPPIWVRRVTRLTLVYMAVHGERRCINIYTCLQVNLEICSRRSAMFYLNEKRIAV